MRCRVQFLKSVRQIGRNEIRPHRNLQPGRLAQIGRKAYAIANGDFVFNARILFAGLFFRVSQALGIDFKADPLIEAAIRRTRINFAFADRGLCFLWNEAKPLARSVWVFEKCHRMGNCLIFDDLFLRDNRQISLPIVGKRRPTDETKNRNWHKAFHVVSFGLQSNSFEPVILMFGAPSLRLALATTKIRIYSSTRSFFTVPLAILSRVDRSKIMHPFEADLSPLPLSPWIRKPERLWAFF